MKTTERQATARLLKKLSALRATLSNEERAILDSWIVVEEVQAHRMNSRATGKAAEVRAHKMTAKTTSKAADRSTEKATEVAAHRMTGKAVSKTVSKATPRATEVAAHRMTTKAAGKAANKATDKTAMRIAFDPNSEEYKITD